MKYYKGRSFIKKENTIQLLQLEVVLEWMEESYKLNSNNSENLWDFEYEKSPIKNYRLSHL